jgi:hypothetical protein
MRNITFRAPEELIERARLVARARHQTLNDAFREWLQQYVGTRGSGSAVDTLMLRLRHIHSSGPNTRDGMNIR